MQRIDTHHHFIPPVYRKALLSNGIDQAGGRALPDWTPEASVAAMADLGIATAILSVSAPGTAFLPDADDAADLARAVNDYGAGLVASAPDRFGLFATVPLPHVRPAAAEAARALDGLRADGVILLANNAGVYLGEDDEQDELWRVLDERSAVVFVHPATLPGPAVPGVVPFAVDFLLDTTRAAYLLVRNGIRSRYPNIKFILSHGGGFVPYAAHRMAMAITGDVNRSPADSLAEFASFYFDTALSSTESALPSLLAFAKPGHVTFGSDFPFAPAPVGQYFAAGLADNTDAAVRYAIDRTNALRLFPRLGSVGPPAAPGIVERLRGGLSRGALRLMYRAVAAARR